MVLIGRVGLMPCQPYTRKTQTWQPPLWPDSPQKGRAVSQLQTSVQKGWLLWAWSCQHGTLSSQAPRLTTSTTHQSKNPASIEFQHSREGVQHRGSVAISGRERESFGAVSEWSSGRGPIPLLSRVTRLEWIQKSSVHCSSVASGCHCPSTHAFADVAVSQTALAIIGLRVLSQVLWSACFRGGGCCGTHLSRGRSKGLDQRDGP